MIDQQAFALAIAGALTGNADLTDIIEQNPEGSGPGIYWGEIPEGAALPAVLLDFSFDARDVNPQGSQRQMSGGILLARAVDQSDEIPWAISEQIDLSFGGGAGLSVLVDRYAIRIHRLSPFDLPQTTDGTPFRQAGARYRVEASHRLV